MSSSVKRRRTAKNSLLAGEKKGEGSAEAGKARKLMVRPERAAMSGNTQPSDKSLCSEENQREGQKGNPRIGPKKKKPHTKKSVSAQRATRALGNLS